MICAIASLLFAPSLSVEWHVHKFANGVIGLFSSSGVLLTFLLVNAIREGRLIPAVLHLSATVCLALAACGCWCSRSRPRVFEVIEVGCYAVMAAIFPAVSVFTDDNDIRQQQIGYVFLLIKVMPILTGMRKKVYLGFLLWNLSFDFTCLWLIAFRYENSIIPVRACVIFIVYAFGITTMGMLHQKLMFALQDAEQSMMADEKAREALLSMFCDATFWLASDANAVTHCDNRFSSMMGRNMVGEKLYSFMGDEERERARWQDAFTHDPLSHGPVFFAVFPTTLYPENGVPVSVHLYIVGNGRLRASNSVLRQGYLIGACMQDSSASGSSKPAVLDGRIAQILEAPSGSTGPPAHELRLLDTDESEAVSAQQHEAFDPAQQEAASAPDTQSLALSVPKTTATGDFFDGLCAYSGSDAEQWLKALYHLGEDEHWMIRPTEVKLLPEKVLGSGSYGVVVRGAVYGTPVAVKVSRGDATAGMSRTLKSLSNELRVLRHCRHPNLVPFHGAVVDPRKLRIGIILEFVRGGDLNTFMTENDGPSLCAQYQILLGLCCGLWYLHTRRPAIVHGDLKSENVLVERGPLGVQPKLTDFGLSRVLTRNPRPQGGSLLWMAPEVYQRQGKNPNPSGDVFSFGRLCFFVLTGLKPLVGMSSQQVAAILQSGFVPALVWPDRSVLEWFSRPLVAACLEMPDSSRPTMEQAHKAIINWPIHGLPDDLTVAIKEATCDDARPWSDCIDQILSESSPDGPPKKVQI